MRIALLLTLACGLLALAPDAVQDGLSLDRHALLGGEAWRLWSGHFVHFSASHATGDLVLLFVVTLLAQREFGSWVTLIALLAAAPLVSLGLVLLVPELAVYRGSSALSAFLGVAVGMRLWCQTARLRLALATMGVVLTVAMCLEAAESFAGFSSLPGGVRVAWQAHLIGGLIAGMWMFSTMRRNGGIEGTTMMMCVCAYGRPPVAPTLEERVHPSHRSQCDGPQG